MTLFAVCYIYLLRECVCVCVCEKLSMLSDTFRGEKPRSVYRFFRFELCKRARGMIYIVRVMHTEPRIILFKNPFVTRLV